MLIIPAIDLRKGKVVRLCQGRRDAETVYSSAPEDAARLWEEKGARCLHIVDLDGAFEGRPKNLTAVREILRCVNIPIELGGGIRTLEEIEMLLNLGVQWVILGTSLILNPKLVKEALKRFPDRILVSLDARQGRVLIKGWQDKTVIPVKDLAQDLEKIGITRIIYTDITRDGMMVGPNLGGIKKILSSTNLEIIASGGISSLMDLKRLKRLAPKGLRGVIIGRALYEGRIDLEEAIDQATEDR